MIQGIVIACGIFVWLWLHWKFWDFPSISPLSHWHCCWYCWMTLRPYTACCTGHFHVWDKMRMLSGEHLLTGFLQASFQCWQDIWTSTWIQRVGICGCPMFSSVFILAGSEQNKSWLLQSWCGGQWTWCFEDYTIWEARYPGRCAFLDIKLLLCSACCSFLFSPPFSSPLFLLFPSPLPHLTINVCYRVNLVLAHFNVEL